MVAEVSSSRKRVRAPSSRASRMAAARLVEPEASSVEKKLALLDIGEVLRLVDVGEEGPRVQVLEEAPEVLQKGLEEPRRLLPQDAPAMGGKAQAEAQMKLLPQVGPGPLQDLGAFHGHVDLPGVAASPHPGQGAEAGLEAP